MPSLTPALIQGGLIPGGLVPGLVHPLDPASPLVTDFAATMRRLGPFEPSPHLAVAVSGGSDSLALLLLLEAWCRSCDGRLTALSVDHGLRPDAAAECAQVGVLIAALNDARSTSGHPSHPIDHVILAWRGEKPATGLMAAAREARYHLLATWCRDQDVLHLAVGHHADDQAETVLMRQDHGSSVFGLAGMAGSRELGGVRLIRPVLGWRKAELRALVAAAGIAWIEDPSNSADRFERVRWRQQLAAGEAAGESDLAPSLILAAACGQERDQVEREAADWLAAHGRLHPAGAMALDLPAFRNLAPVLATHILRQGILTIGGGDFAPGPAALARLLDTLVASAGIARPITATLGGCLLMARDGVLALYREAADCGPALPFIPSSALVWDRRWVMQVPAADENICGDLEIAAVGELGLANRTLPPALAGQSLPLRASLPGLWRDGRLMAVAGILNSGELAAAVAVEAAGGVNYNLDMSFKPAQTATSCGFTVVLPAGHTM